MAAAHTQCSKHANSFVIEVNDLLSLFMRKSEQYVGLLFDSIVVCGASPETPETLCKSMTLHDLLPCASMCAQTSSTAINSQVIRFKAVLMVFPSTDAAANVFVSRQFMARYVAAWNIFGGGTTPGNRGREN